MSSFIVSENTMHLAVAGLQHLAREGEAKLENFGKDAQDVGQKLFNLNARAVAGRYNEPVELIRYRYHPTHSSKIACLKALRCLAYQCNEDATADDRLFRCLQEACSTLAESIISDLPEYRAAAWDAA